MKIKRLTGGDLESNGYILYRRQGGACYVVDPGYNPRSFIRFIEEMDLDMKGILLTHHHPDHVGGVEKIKETFDCPVSLHRADMDRYRRPVEIPLEGGERIWLEEEPIDVIHTPGHTAGGVCYYAEKSKTAFTGDTIFNVDLGRTDLAGGSEMQMIATCRNIINRWSNEIFIYPGHGDGCTMKKVREINTEFLGIVGEQSWQSN